MKSLSRNTFAYVAALGCALCFVVLNCVAQTVPAKSSDQRAVRERIATIFRETLKNGETLLTQKSGGHMTARTLLPPSTEHVEEIQRYGDEAIPILEEYLNSDSGFERYLAMRFLGLIGSRAVVEPLGKVALYDSSSSFRLSALLWLTQTPWDLAAPIIRQVAVNDVSAEVRDEAKEILAQHMLIK